MGVSASFKRTGIVAEAPLSVVDVVVDDLNGGGVGVCVLAVGVCGVGRGERVDDGRVAHGDGVVGVDRVGEGGRGRGHASGWFLIFCCNVATTDF